jgi:hypothetical protein
MKKKLNNIGPKKRHRFRGEFVRYGQRDGWWSGNNVTVLLRNICLAPEGEEVAEHLWFNWTGGFQRLGNLEAGDLIEFDARASRVVKGYRGGDFLLQAENSPRTVWKLSHPSRVVKIGQAGLAD